MVATITPNDQDLVTLKKMVPGIFSKLIRLPSVVKAVKSALHVSDDDYLSLGWKLEENARIYPGKPAILFEEESITHKEFNTGSWTPHLDALLSLPRNIASSQPNGAEKIADFFLKRISTTAG